MADKQLTTLYVRSGPTKVWHRTLREQPVCGVVMNEKKLLWIKRLRRGDKLCPNCRNLMYDRNSPLHNESEGIAKLAAWVQEERMKAGIEDRR